jgi:hypothetical protein
VKSEFFDDYSYLLQRSQIIYALPSNPRLRDTSNLTHLCNRLKDNKDLFTGLVWLGQDAYDLGLIDGIGDANFLD